MLTMKGEYVVLECMAWFSIAWAEAMHSFSSTVEQCANPPNFATSVHRVRNEFLTCTKGVRDECVNYPCASKEAHFCRRVGSTVYVG